MTTADPIALPRRSLAPPPLQRARGEVRLKVRVDGTKTRLFENYQAGAAKLRFPRVASDGPLEAVLVNTAGGITGGDRMRTRIVVGDGARALVTTQAAERVYRRNAGTAIVATELSLGPGAALDWLPQETIVFDRSALQRSLQADIAGDARLLAVEAVVLGRAAMSEAVRTAAVTDSWRIRRDGKPVFADSLRLDGDAAAIMAGRATGGGARALATVVLVAPDAIGRVDAARATLQDGAGESGVSAWNGMLVARLVAADGETLRAGLIRLIETLRGRPMPRLWSC